MPKYEHLFKPIKIGNVEISNRLVHVPTDTSSAEADGQVSAKVIAYHEEIAKGGTGFIIVGASTPDKETGRPTVTCISVDADYYIPGLARLAESMHRHGAKCAVQIQHPGRQAAYPRNAQISCSDMISDLPGSAGHEVVYAGGDKHGKIAREMTVEEIYDMIEKFAEGAWRVQQAGFDAVELHGAHGYLIAQFMSPYTNKRNDRFGSSFENRMRFPVEIIRRIKYKCGDNFPILVRYSGEEYMPGSRTLDESVKIAQLLEKEGVAAVDISAGIFDAPGPTMDPAYYDEGWNTYTAEAIKKAVHIPVITSHSLRNPEYCEKVLAEGKADMVGLSRQMIADPYWAIKAKAGKDKEIRRCVSCLVGCWKESLMVKQELKCAINPAIDDVRFLNIKPAHASMRVAIVGGGVAGMEAAYIATLRGHKVTLFEKESELGGIIRTCCRVPVKKKWKWYIDWIREQLAALNVDVRFDNLDNYDAVLCGTGTKLIKPNILGIDKAISYEDVLRCTQRNCQYFTERPAPAKLGHTVVVWGNHYQASDTAEMIAMKGREVIVVTEDKEFCPDIETIHREVMMMRFSGGNGQCLEGKPISIPVKVKTRTTVSEIGDEYVVLMDDKFNKETIKVDNVVLSKVESNTDLYDQLLAAGKKVAKMGDARIVKNVHNAVRDGANLAFIIDDDIFMNSNNMLTAGLPVDVALSMNR